MEWDENTPDVTLTQLEEVVLKMRKRLGEQMAQAVVDRQENRQPAEKQICPECGGEMIDKGQKDNHVESMLGGIELERSYYYCPKCRKGDFPLDRQMRIWERHWSEQVAKQAVWLSGLVTYEQAV
jgi:uncharacterized protein with PIN domain